MYRPLLVLCIAPLLFSCASGSSKPLRFVDCTRTAYCTPNDEWPNPAPAEKHQALYTQGIRTIVHEMACGKMVTRGRRLAFVSVDDVSPSCGSGTLPVRRVKDRDHGNRLLASGEVDFVVEFERSNATGIKDGIELPVSAVFYGKANKRGTESRLEGIDNYLIVKIKDKTELRLLSRAAHE